MAKKPKKPKRSASLARWQAYDAKLAQWEKDRKAKEALLRKHS